MCELQLTITNDSYCYFVLIENKLNSFILPSLFIYFDFLSMHNVTNHIQWPLFSRKKEIIPSKLDTNHDRYWMKSLYDSLTYYNNLNRILSRIDSKVEVDNQKKAKLWVKRSRITFLRKGQVSRYNYSEDSKAKIDRD